MRIVSNGKWVYTILNSLDAFDIICPPDNYIQSCKQYDNANKKDYYYIILSQLLVNKELDKENKLYIKLKARASGIYLAYDKSLYLQEDKAIVKKNKDKWISIEVLNSIEGNYPSTILTREYNINKIESTHKIIELEKLLISK